jgi:hypothetical protein
MRGPFPPCISPFIVCTTTLTGSASHPSSRSLHLLAASSETASTSTAVKMRDPLIPAAANKWSKRTLDCLGLTGQCEWGTAEDKEGTQALDKSGASIFLRLISAEQKGSEVSNTLKLPKDLQKGRILGQY